MTDHSIKGKTVLIAGGAKNLGGLIARDLAAQGAKAITVHYNTSATKQAADETVAAIKAAGAQAFAFQGDLTTAGAVEKLFTDAKAAMGSIDIAINTVGKVLKKPMVEISEAEYDEMTAVNSKTAFFFLKEAGRNVSDNGKVVTLVTSLLGAFTPFYAAYAGTKAPVEHFTRAASKEFGERGISVTAIGPGPMDTPFFYPAEGEDAVAYHKTAAALSGFSKTGLTDIEDIVPFIRFLVSVRAFGMLHPRPPNANHHSAPDDVVAYWRASSDRWFEKDAAFDADFRDRFLDLHMAVAGRRHDQWIETPGGALALLILTDQFPRNAFRGTAHMYATDPLARCYARQALEAGHMVRVEPDLRLFFCLPFAHSEDLADQELSVRLNARLGQPWREHADGHRDIIRRFGRFPHRNCVLGRTMTPEEDAYLKGGGFPG